MVPQNFIIFNNKNYKMENIKKSFKKFIARKIEKICAIDFYRTKKWENPCYKIL